MTYEQPKHLSEVCYARAMSAWRLLFVISAVFMSGFAVIAQWQNAKAGHHISILESVIVVIVGVAGVGLLLWLGLRFETKRRRYLEFRSNGLFLTGLGLVTSRRIVNWSLSPDSADPRYTRLCITYKSGLGRQRWSILLDDRDQIAKLRDALAAHILQAHAA